MKRLILRSDAAYREIEVQVLRAGGVVITLKKDVRQTEIVVLDCTLDVEVKVLGLVACQGVVVVDSE